MECALKAISHLSSSNYRLLTSSLIIETVSRYFDITVEDIGDDYDVEQLASKIRSMLYDDATYRNVNALSFSR
jgi:hypothetical protein